MNLLKNCIARLNPFILTSGDIDKLTITHILRSFSLGMISIFVPIFLYNKGFSILEIVLYEIVFYILVTVSTPIQLKFNSVFGTTKGMRISLFFTIIYYFMLYNSDFLILYNRYFFLFLIIIFYVLGDVMYWMGFHLNFCINFNEDKRGKQLGLITSLPIIFSILAPLFGGILITHYSFIILFEIVIFLLIVALVPLMLANNVKPEVSKLKIKKIFNFSNKKLNFIYIIDGVCDISVNMFWPVYLFFIKITLTSIGFFYSISKTLSSISSYLVSKLSQNKDKIPLIFKFGSIFYGFIIFIRNFFQNIGVLTFFQSLSGIGVQFYNIPFMSKYYESSKLDPLNSTASREIYLNVGRLIALSILLILILNLELVLALIVFFCINGILVMSSNFLSKGLK